MHASGEVWAQTMWDLRERFGRSYALSLITRAMELSAADPTMLDMRNAIVQVDLVATGGKNAGILWQVFANRGMGWFAGALDGGDSRPVEDFHIPPTGATTTHHRHRDRQGHRRRRCRARSSSSAVTPPATPVTTPP